MMQKEIGPPVEDVGFAWIQLRRPLILVDRIERIAQLLVDRRKKMMKLRPIAAGQECRAIFAGTLVVARVRIRTCQIVAILVISGVKCGSALEIRDRFASLALLD